MINLYRYLHERYIIIYELLRYIQKSFVRHPVAFGLLPVRHLAHRLGQRLHRPSASLLRRHWGHIGASVNRGAERNRQIAQALVANGLPLPTSATLLALSLPEVEALEDKPMPRQNRVTPFSTLIATPARGTLMGNRGCLHDSQGTLRRAYQGKRWIICLLAFKNRRRSVMTPGHYTELFFLDEATALAAGHRPCAECQRERFNLFRSVWAAANPQHTATPTPPVAVIDTVLHQERLYKEEQPVIPLSQIDQLPDGSFVAPLSDSHAYLVLHGKLLHWSSLGYAKLSEPITAAEVRLLTPPSIVRALRKGYVVGIHSSAVT